MNWFSENMEWLFSGVAIVLPLTIIGWILSAKKIKQIQKGGKNSTNIQVGGDYTSKMGDDNE